MSNQLKYQHVRGMIMAVRPILTAENPLLRQRSKKVKRFGDNLSALVEDMFDTMHSAYGLGLAAPQIGVLQRVFVVEMPAEYDEEGRELEPARQYVLVNPEIIRKRDEVEMEEGCLSVPGYRGLVKRANEITIKGQDADGKTVRYRGSDLLAQAFQHELDHLNGVLYIDLIDGPGKLWPIEVGEEEEEAVVIGD
jgi:peptide deformylase